VFESCPPILILLLKRFVYDEARGALKLDKHISFPSKLEIKHSVSPKPPCYKLYAGTVLFNLVVNHHGKFVQGGHYTADINQKETWTRFDDNDVKPVSENIVFGQQSDRQPYILFYRLV
jgi:ubiquitin carboxyl-terminal hydrolase 10